MEGKELLSYFIVYLVIFGLGFFLFKTSKFYIKRFGAHNLLDEPTHRKMDNLGKRIVKFIGLCIMLISTVVLVGYIISEIIN